MKITALLISTLDLTTAAFTQAGAQQITGGSPKLEPS